MSIFMVWAIKFQVHLSRSHLQQVCVLSQHVAFRTAAPTPGPAGG